jgi:hypothetical protein
VPDDFLIARNPDPASSLPYLIRVPLGDLGVVLKARDTWPRTAKIYCHRAEGWPPNAEIVQRVGTRSCTRRGAAIDLVLDRGAENRSQIVFTRIRGGREAIFWQSARTAKQARPNVTLPTRRAADLPPFEIVVDAHERYAYRFSHQQVRTRRAALAAGDYAVFLDGDVVATVERKSLADLASSLLNGKLRYALAELASVERAAVVVEDRYSAIFKLPFGRPSTVANALAEIQVRWPEVPVMFTETRALAEEWTYRFLGAARAELSQDRVAAAVHSALPVAGAMPGRTAPSVRNVRAWAVAAGWPVADRGRLRPEVVAAYEAAHSDGATASEER